MADTVTGPVEAHVDRLGVFWADGASGKTNGAEVVAVDGNWRLWVTEVGEGLAEVTEDLETGEETAVLSFGGGGNHDGDANGELV